MRTLLFLVFALAATPARGAPQEQVADTPAEASSDPEQVSCEIVESSLAVVENAGELLHFYDPVFDCGDGALVRADSATTFSTTGRTRFNGNFEYRDSTAFMTADRADHFVSEGRLVGVGNVYITDAATGAVFEGDSTVLLGTGVGRTGELTITGQRAHAVIWMAPPADSVADEGDAAVDTVSAPDSSVAVDSASGVVSDSAGAAEAAIGAGPDSTSAFTDATEDTAASPTDSADALGGGDVEDTVAPSPDSANLVTDSTTVTGPEDPPVPASDSMPAAPDSTITGTEADSAAVGAPSATPSAGGTADDSTVAAEAVNATDPASRELVRYDIDAEHIYLRGIDYLLAIGNAELRTEDFRALADSLEYLETEGKLFLRGSAPRIHGLSAESMLSGTAVDLDMNGDRVTARGDATLEGGEVEITAPEIRVLMQDGALDRIVALAERPLEEEASPEAGAETPADPADPPPEAQASETPDEASPEEDPAAEGGRPDIEGRPLIELPPADSASGPESDAEAPAEGQPSDSLVSTSDSLASPSDSAEVALPARPTAISQDFELQGDSIEVLAPNEVLERVIAVGDARGESLVGNSLNTEDIPEIARSDWVAGDTIIASFRPSSEAQWPEQDEAGEQTTTISAPDTAAQGGYQIDQLVARGQAKSLYRTLETDGAAGGPEETETAPDGTEDDEGRVDSVPEAPEQAPPEDAAPPGSDADTLASGAPEAGGESPEASRAQEESEVAEPAAGESESPGIPQGPRLTFHYLRSDQITIFMENGMVTSVSAEGNVQGVQFEPIPLPSADPAPSDSTSTSTTTTPAGEMR